MIYRVALEADKHWGAMKMEDQYRSSFILKQFLAEFPIDLYIYLGDFFDTKLLLNSKSSVYAIRDFTEKIEICRARGIPCRAIKGTRSHDYDQWEVFDNFMSNKAYNFRYFKTASIEETLPGFTIWYAPEENMNFGDYIDLYYDLLTSRPIHMAALHGNFDRIMPSVAVAANENNADSTTLIFHYEDLETIVRGPMIAGHWHDGDTSDHLTYVGSYDRWTFGEDEIKGFCILEYNTETLEYRIIKVPNILAAEYDTYEFRVSQFQSSDDWVFYADSVAKHLEKDIHAHIRILCRIDEIAPDTEQQIEILKYRFSNERRVHFTIVNQVKQEKKKTEKQEKKRMDETFGFIYNKNMDLAEKIQKYIQVTTGKEYRAADIRELINKYVM